MCILINTSGYPIKLILSLSAYCLFFGIQRQYPCFFFIIYLFIKFIYSIYLFNLFIQFIYSIYLFNLFIQFIYSIYLFHFLIFTTGAGYHW
jgi:hypothetical protein